MKHLSEIIKFSSLEIGEEFIFDYEVDMFADGDLSSKFPYLSVKEKIGRNEYKEVENKIILDRRKKPTLTGLNSSGYTYTEAYVRRVDYNEFKVFGS